MTENPFHKNYRTLQRWQVRCQENYLERLRRMAPNDHQALAQAEQTLAQMQAALSGDSAQQGTLSMHAPVPGPA